MRLKFSALAISLVFSTQSIADDVLAVMSPYGTKAQVQQLVPVIQQQLSQNGRWRHIDGIEWRRR